MRLPDIPPSYALALAVTSCQKQIEEKLLTIRLRSSFSDPLGHSDLEIKEARRDVEMLGLVSDWLFRLSMTTPDGEGRMEKAEIKPGKLYAIAGQGPMRVKALHSHSVECSTLDGLTYWAGYDQVIRRVGRSYLRTWVDQLIKAKIVPPDYTTELERGLDDDDEQPA